MFSELITEQVDSVSEKLARLHDIANANLTGLIQQVALNYLWLLYC